MKAILICPDRRANVAFLARKTPLVLVPALGPSVLCHWLEYLAEQGAKEVTLLASDRPDRIRAEAGRGERWGLKIEVLPEARELSPAEAGSRFPGRAVYLADHLPALKEAPLFESYEAFFGALRRWAPLAQKRRIGVKELSPGIWAGLRCRIDPTARLIAPCWLGENVWVRSGATVGPEAFIEDAAMVDHSAEVSRSWLGPWTYAGAMTHVNNSFGWADGLLDHTSGSFTEIVDAFLLCDLRGGRGFALSSPWPGRLAALIAVLLTSPLMLAAAMKNAGSGQPLLVRKRAVVPTAIGANTTLREQPYSELNGVRGLARRWPQLWSIVRGDFTWVGNRPLTREQAGQLETEFEQLWLAAPVGLISLADKFGCGDRFDDDARAHASFYAVRTSSLLDREVLRWLCLSSLRKLTSWSRSS